jgi:predicted porin
MNRTLFAMAVLWVFAGPASAQSSVAIYGAIDLGIARERDAAGTVVGISSGMMNGSRLGFKGAEDLGHGLSAIFTVENGFAADTGAMAQGGLLFGRQAFVGLAGKFGTIRLGRQQTPVYRNNDVFDPFCNGMAGDSIRLINYSGSRTNNMISYTYDANGFRGQLQYAPGEMNGNNVAGRTVAGFGGYRQGAVDIVATYQRTYNASGTIGGMTALVGGNYDLGYAKLYGAYAWNRDVMAPTGVFSQGADMRNVLLGASIPTGGAGNIKVSYIVLQNKAVANAKSRQFGLGYVYDLSKRTALYASGARLSNEARAGLYSSTPGGENRLYNAGIRHWF